MLLLNYRLSVRKHYSTTGKNSGVMAHVLISVVSGSTKAWECVYLSSNRFFMTWENGILISFLFFVFLRSCQTEFYFHFHFSFFIYPWHWKTDLIFVRSCHSLKNGFEFQFLFFVFASLWKRDLNFGFRISFFASLWKTELTFVFRFRITLKNIWHPLLFRLSHKLIGNFSETWDLGQLLRGFGKYQNSRQVLIFFSIFKIVFLLFSWHLFISFQKKSQLNSTGLYYCVCVL